MLAIQEIDSDAEVQSAFALMAQLRDRITAESFPAQVRRQQREGYVLLGGKIEQEWVVLAGIRNAHTLSRGEHIFVDDLVTDAAVRGKGHGTQMLRWIAARAKRQGIPRIYLDSRNTARTFYEQAGFTCLTSVPCWIDVAALG
jgi:GNAT superfamily N-acetyltransferase